MPGYCRSDSFCQYVCSAKQGRAPGGSTLESEEVFLNTGQGPLKPQSSFPSSMVPFSRLQPLLGFATQGELPISPTELGAELSAEMASQTDPSGRTHGMYPTITPLHLSPERV